jgi:hypothetical protein
MECAPHFFNNANINRVIGFMYSLNGFFFVVHIFSFQVIWFMYFFLLVFEAKEFWL